MDQLPISLSTGRFLVNLGSERCKVEFNCRSKLLNHSGNKDFGCGTDFIKNHMRMLFRPAAEEQRAFFCQLNRPPNGIAPIVLYTPILDTTQYKDLLGSVITDIVLAVLSFGAQLEVDTKSKAQAEGIAAAHLKGVKFGRPKCNVENWDTYYSQWKAGQITAVQCYKQLGVSASTFYRLVREYETEEKMT